MNERSGRRHETRLFLVHIPKTAGVSLDAALRTWAGEGRSLRYAYGGLGDAAAFRDLSDEELMRMRLISGHLSNAIFRERLDKSWKALTIVRDPVERFSSLYSYVRATTDHPWHDEIRDMSPGDFFAWQRKDPTEANRQSRMISARPDASAAWRALTTRFFLAASIGHLPDFAAALSRAIGAEIETPHLNRTTDETRFPIPADVAALVRLRDHADVELFERVDAATLVGTATRSRPLAFLLSWWDRLREPRQGRPEQPSASSPR